MPMRCAGLCRGERNGGLDAGDHALIDAHGAGELLAAVHDAMADGDQLIGQGGILGWDVAHDVVEGFLVRGTGAQHGVALDPVEFPFDTCVIQIEAFGQAGQHVLARFSVHYGKFQEELPQLRINTNLLMFYIFLCFGFTPTVSCHPAMDGIPLPGAYGRRRVRPIFQIVGRRPFVWRARRISDSQRASVGPITRDPGPGCHSGAGQQRPVNLDDQLLDRTWGRQGTEGAMQFSRPEDGEVAGLQRQITGLLVIDEPEIGVRMVGTVPAVGVRAHADPLAAQQQLDVQILLMKLAPAIRHRLCQILAHQAEQREAVDLPLAEGACSQRSTLCTTGHDTVQGAARGALQGIQTAGDQEVRILRYICGLSFVHQMKKHLKVLYRPSAIRADGALSLPADGAESLLHTRPPPPRDTRPFTR